MFVERIEQHLAPIVLEPVGDKSPLKFVDWSSLLYPRELEKQASVTHGESVRQLRFENTGFMRF